jgi:hypothetical protein
MKRSRVAPRGKIEHRGVSKLLDFLPYATQNFVNVESALLLPGVP